MHQAQVLLKKGWTQVQVARKLHLSKSAICRHAGFLGLAKSRPKYNWQKVNKRLKAGITLKQCCSEFGMCHKTIREAVTRGDLIDTIPNQPKKINWSNSPFAEVKAKNPKAKGEKAEGSVLSRLLARGLTVLKPMGDNQRYDLVLESKGKFYRIQVKKARLHNGVLIADAESSTAHRTNGGKQSYKGQVEYFAYYYPPLDKIYIIPVNSLNGSIALRLTPPKNKQIRGVKYAKDFELV